MKILPLSASYSMRLVFFIFSLFLIQRSEAFSLNSERRSNVLTNIPLKSVAIDNVATNSRSTLSSLCDNELPTEAPTDTEATDDKDGDSPEKHQISDTGLSASFETMPLESKFPPSKKFVPEGIAVILNSNARGVSADMVRAVQEQASKSCVMRVYATSSFEEAQQAIAELKENPAKVVVPIGGDGTLTTVIQMLHDSDAPLPKIGYLPMGTGNALGTVIGCNPKRRFRRSKRLKEIQNVLNQLCSIALKNLDSDETDEVDIVDVPLMQVTTTSKEQKQQVYCFFAGIGFDSLMLQDYKELQDWSSKSKIWKDKFASVWGYSVALFTRTLPKCIAHQSHLVQLEVTTTEPALWVDHRRGDVVRSIKMDGQDGDGSNRPTLLYKGQAGIAAASTTPFYGGNLKLFPFARLSENGCQVRIGRIHPLTGFVNIPKIFQGTYRNLEMGCLDFLGTQFTVTVDDDSHPVQHSGESMGLAQKVELVVQKEPVRFVTLMPPRLVRENDD